MVDVFAIKTEKEWSHIFPITNYKERIKEFKVFLENDEELGNCNN